MSEVVQMVVLDARNKLQLSKVPRFDFLGSYRNPKVGTEIKNWRIVECDLVHSKEDVETNNFCFWMMWFGCV